MRIFYGAIPASIYGEFVDENGDALGGDETVYMQRAKCYPCNRQAAVRTVLRPVLLRLQHQSRLVMGIAVNYTLTASNGVGYEWGNIPAGLSIQNGNQRKLIGTITGGVGASTPRP
jgi:hypothetical protein